MKVDVSGLICPVPVRVVREHLADLDPTEELLVVGDYPPAEESIYRACTMHGFDVRRVDSDGIKERDDAAGRVSSGISEPDDTIPDDIEFALRIRPTEFSSLGKPDATSR